MHGGMPPPAPKRKSRKEPTEKLRRVIRDPDNLVRCLTIELEIELGLGAAIIPVRKGAATYLPPYMVFCAWNANVRGIGSLTSALIANIILLRSRGALTRTASSILPS